MSINRYMPSVLALLMASASYGVQADVTSRIQCALSSSNDNGPWKADDNGKSFGAGFGCKISGISVDAKMDSYTNSKPDTTEGAVDMRHGGRIDTAMISLRSDIREDSGSWGKNILSLGGGIGGIGNLGGRKIQQAWHVKGPDSLTKNNGKFIDHEETYEANGSVISRFPRTSVTGSTFLLRARSEYESPILLGDAQYGLSAFSSLDATFPFRRRYAETNIIGEAGVRGKLDRLRLDVSITKYLYRELPISRVIRAAENNPEKYATVKFSGEVWKEDGYTINPYIQVQRSLEKGTPAGSKNQGTAGVNISWK